jgi:pimeloyl-ACP methyl ester carboxylesterase
MLGMFLPGSEVDARFARQFELGVRGFRYANPRKSVFPRPYDDEQLQALSVPTLLLIGDQERTYAARKALDRASRLVPAIDARLMAGAGHILAMQKPDTVDAEVVTFLSRPAGS